MNASQIHLIAAGWSLLIVLLTMFWFFTLRRLEVILRERLAATRSHQSISGLKDMLAFLLRGNFKQTGDDRLVAVCGKLRKLLYGYLGCLGGYIVFLIIYYRRY
ncbi:MAG: hypothetical protein ABSE62_08495 [Chthoniobacteraceae bacterium]|jgi:hypothetical protein